MRRVDVNGEAELSEVLTCAAIFPPPIPAISVFFFSTTTTTTGWLKSTISAHKPKPCK